MFVHHFGQASFGSLIPTGEYGRLLHGNKQRFEEKWGRPWQPYARRRSPTYENLMQRIRRAVCQATPPTATVLVVSKGDEELLKLDGRRAWHFPQTEAGIYRGYHPASSEEAIEHLKELSVKGGQFFVIPRATLWWLEHYEGFKHHLERLHRLVVSDRDTCLIFDLRSRKE